MAQQNQQAAVSTDYGFHAYGTKKTTPSRKSRKSQRLSTFLKNKKIKANKKRARRERNREADAAAAEAAARAEALADQENG